MCIGSRGRSAVAPAAALIASVIALLSASAVPAQPASVEELVSAVVRINTHITPDGRTVQGLGREREGSGILIDADGLVLTIGYLMVEAYAAEVVDNNGRAVPANVVGYDHETGFGLLRTIEPLKLKPMPLGKSAEIREGDPVLIASFGGPAMVGGAYVVAKREFAGSWEYLLDEALFTAPPHPAWSGAALINREGKLVGVGSLIVGDAARGSEKVPGNMFVPIDRWADGGSWAAVAWAQHRGTARTAIRQPRDAERSGREGRHQERRCHRRGQWRATEELGRFLSQGLGPRHGGRHGGA
jgi:S1-C subfamily serine protease